MVARRVEEAGRRLRELKREEYEDAAVALAAFGLTLGAAEFWPELVVPLLVGALFLSGKTYVVLWRRWDLLERLAGERDAYEIPEVRARAEQQASMHNRQTLSRAIRTRLELGENPRITVAADDLAALADELADEELDLDPACAVACSRLLTDDATSPLINLHLPAEDVRSRVRQIRRGFQRHSMVDPDA
jgi:hypothetical protein